MRECSSKHCRATRCLKSPDTVACRHMSRELRQAPDVLRLPPARLADNCRHTLAPILESSSPEAEVTG